MATNRDDRPAPALKIFLITASFVIIIAGMKAAQTILVPFLLSIFIAVISSPFLFWLRRKGLPMGIALIIVIICVLGIGLLIGVLVGTSLNDFTRSLPAYQERLQEKATVIIALLERFDIQFSEKQLTEYVDPGAAMRFFSRMLTGLGNVLSNAFLIFITVIFILLEVASFSSKLQAAFKSSDTSPSQLDSITANINRYMIIKTLVSLGTGILVAVWLAVLGVDYPILWGLIAFIFNFVPNIGSIIAAVPAVLLALVLNGLTTALLAAAGYVVLNVGIGSGIEPRFMGRGLGLSTLVVFLSLVFWGWVLGPVGMVLSIPLTMTLKIALANMEETRWISVLLGSASRKHLDN